MIVDLSQPTRTRLEYETVASPGQHVVSGLMVAAAAWCIGFGLPLAWFIVPRILEGTLVYAARPATGLRNLIYYWPYVLFLASIILLSAIFLHARSRSERSSRLLLIAAGAAVVAGAGYPVASVLWWPPSLGTTAYELYQRIIPLWSIVVYALVPALMLLSVLRPTPWHLRASCIGCPLAIGVSWGLVLLMTPLTLFYSNDYSWSWSTAGPVLVRTGTWFATAGLLFVLCNGRTLSFRSAWAVIASLAALHVVVAWATEYWMHGEQALRPTWLLFGALQQIGFLAGVFVLPWIVSRTALASPVGGYAPHGPA